MDVRTQGWQAILEELLQERIAFFDSAEQKSYLEEHLGHRQELQAHCD